jgi:hypothetical protein
LKDYLSGELIPCVIKRKASNKYFKKCFHYTAYYFARNLLGDAKKTEDEIDNKIFALF